MRTLIFYVVGVWFLLSLPLAAFVGRLCRLGERGADVPNPPGPPAARSDERGALELIIAG